MWDELTSDSFLCYGFCSKKSSSRSFRSLKEGEEPVSWHQYFRYKQVLVGNVRVGIHGDFDKPYRFIYSKCYRACSGDVHRIDSFHVPCCEEISNLKQSLRVIKGLDEDTYNKLTDDGTQTEPYWFLVSYWD